MTKYKTTSLLHHYQTFRTLGETPIKNPKEYPLRLLASIKPIENYLQEEWRRLRKVNVVLNISVVILPVFITAFISVDIAPTAWKLIVGLLAAFTSVIAALRIFLNIDSRIIRYSHILVKITSFRRQLELAQLKWQVNETGVDREFLELADEAREIFEELYIDIPNLDVVSMKGSRIKTE
jgi:hypothetical protein